MAYPDEVLADNPWLYWRLSEGAGATVAVDSSPNGRDGTIRWPERGGQETGLGAASIIPNQPSDGSYNAQTSTYYNAMIHLPENGMAAITNNQLTLEAWVQPSGNNTGGYIWGNSELSALEFASTNKIRVRSAADTGTTTISSNGTVSTTEPNHIVATFDLAGSDLTYKLYINGVLDLEVTRTGISFIGSSTSSRYLAAGISFASNFLASVAPTTATLIDDVALYSTALSAERIEAHYNAGIAVSSSTPTEGVVWHSSRTNASVPGSGLVFWPRRDS